MNMDEFSQLPADEKTNVMWDQGICYGQRMVDRSYILSIFKVHDFFVEAKYSRSNNKVAGIRALTEVYEWDAYVDRTIRQLFHLS